MTYKTPTYEQKSIVFFARIYLAGVPPCRVLAIALETNYRYMNQVVKKNELLP